MLRVLLGVNGLALLAALVQAGDIGKWLGSYLQMAAVVEPLLLVELGLLSLARNALWRLPLRLGQACVVGLAGVSGRRAFPLCALAVPGRGDGCRRACGVAGHGTAACCWPISNCARVPCRRRRPRPGWRR